MCKEQIITEEHHRRCISLDGKKGKVNISYVKSSLHKDWHTLFGNMNAYQICKRINAMHYKPNNVFVICKFINGSEVLKNGENCSKKRQKYQVRGILYLKEWNLVKLFNI